MKHPQTRISLLVLIAILDKKVIREDIHAEAEKALDIFYSVYKDEIGDCIELSIFEPFKKATRFAFRRLDQDRRQLTRVRSGLRLW